MRAPFSTSRNNLVQRTLYQLCFSRAWCTTAMRGSTCLHKRMSYPAEPCFGSLSHILRASTFAKRITLCVCAARRQQQKERVAGLEAQVATLSRQLAALDAQVRKRVKLAFGVMTAPGRIAPQRACFSCIFHSPVQVKQQHLRKATGRGMHSCARDVVSCFIPRLLFHPCADPIAFDSFFAGGCV